MANGEFHEPIAALDAQQSGFGSLSNYAMERQNAQLAQDIAKSMGDTLPALTLYWKDGAANHAETRKVLPGEPIKSDDLKDSHVKASKTEEEGRKATIAEYPNGVGLKVKEGTKPETIEGRFHVVKSEAEISHGGDLHKKGNAWINENGKEIIKRNDDGSYTIDSGEGFFRQGPKGIEKVTALRNRNGSFQEINTKDPLGALKPSDLTSKKK